MSDDKDKIQKASQILEKYQVGKNLTYLVDNYYHPDTEGLVWDKDFKVSDVPKGYRVLRFTFKGKVFELIASENRMGFFGDGSLADFAMSVDGDLVLKSVVKTSRDEMFSYKSVSVSAYDLKEVKIGEWMEDIAEVRRLDAEQCARETAKREAEKAAATAAKIDLGKYGDT